MKLLVKLFTHKTDKIVEEIHEKNRQDLKAASKEAKALKDLLKKNGVSMQIFIATGGDHR